VRDQAGNAFDPDAAGEQHAAVDGGLQHVPLEWTQDAVMAVLVTAIHAFAAMQDVDARDKPAHD